MKLRNRLIFITSIVTIILIYLTLIKKEVRIVFRNECTDSIEFLVKNNKEILLDTILGYSGHYNLYEFVTNNKFIYRKYQFEINDSISIHKKVLTLLPRQYVIIMLNDEYGKIKYYFEYSIMRPLFGHVNNLSKNYYYANYN